jgi:hypothetical protein
VSAELRIGAESPFAQAGGGELWVNATDDGSAPVVAAEAEPDWERVELVRRIACRLDDGALLAIAAVRPQGAEHHDAEIRTAVLLEPEGEAATAEEALLSIEYDDEGEAQRLGFELHFGGDEEAPPTRGAAVREEDGFAFSVDGRKGPGSYELIKPS